jgi:peptide/nickel transport system ATP-binding protein
VTGPAGDIRSSHALLTVEDLTVDALTDRGATRVLHGISFALRAGETLCLAGESGSGKSVTSLSIMRLLPRASLRIASGRIVLAGADLTRLSDRAMREVRGGDVAMIFQEPMTSLNPVMSVGAQLVEAIKTHQEANERAARSRALDMLNAVHITQPARRLTQYPHELSGGMRQRVMIAMALSCRPKVLIADEPTTALDVTVQAQILRLIRELKSEFGTSVLLITHDMGVVAEMADRVAVMREGRIVEIGATVDVFERPQAVYTRELIAAVPRIGAMAGTDGPPRLTAEATTARPAAPDVPVLVVRDLTVSYGGGTGWLGRGEAQAAVEAVSFEVMRGKTLGLVGESGSGKSSTGKAVLGLIPFSGEVLLDGHKVTNDRGPRAMRPVRRLAQMIFQDPYASLDPRMTVGAAIAEPLIIHGMGGGKAERVERVADLLRRVGLSPDVASRFPHEFSGGQRQRICIARALALRPKLIVADESLAALDVSVRARVLDLMLELQETEGLAYLFISHDMAIVERVSHSVAVMKAGRIVEIGPRRAVFEAPREAYTRELIAAVPIPLPAISHVS